MAVRNNFRVAYILLGIFICVNGSPVKPEDAPLLNTIQGSSANADQLTSATVDKEAPNNLATNAKGDLKGADTFGLGYYLPIVTPTLVKYHYPVVYYPTTYLHSIRHHGFGAYGFFHHGHGVIH